MVACNMCGKEFKNTQGLRGHRTFVHPDADGSGVRPVALQHALCAPELPSAQHASVAIEQLSKLEQQMADFDERLDHAERELAQLGTDSADVPPHVHPEFGEMKAFAAEYTELLRALKNAVEQEQAKSTCVYTKCTISDVFSKWDGKG